MTIIYKIISFIKDNWKWLLSILVAALLIYFMYSNYNLRREIRYNKHNIEVLTDSLHTWTLREGEWITERGLIIANSKNELEKMTSIKEKEIKSLEKELKEHIILVTDLNARIDMLQDSLFQINSGIIEQTDTTEYKLYFDYNDAWRTLEGYTTIISETTPKSFETVFTKDKLNISLRTGLTDNYNIFITSDCPYISITNIEGAVIDPSKFSENKAPKRWGIGPMVGYGYTIGPNKFGVFIGIGVGYNLIRF